MRLYFPVFIVLLKYSTASNQLRTDNEFWNSLAKNELEEALKVKWNLGVANNVIMFIGDGMGPNTVTSTRIYKGGETYRLAYEKFPHIGLLKTYSADKMVPDSACTATALLCGVKVNQETAGVDATVKYRDCDASLKPEARLKSLAVLAQDAGKSTGLVTTMRVTHATPSPVYGHIPDRKWECESVIPLNARHCKDIARQLVEDEPGKNLNVIMGGGRQMLVSNASGTRDDPIDKWSGQRMDARNLTEYYINDKEQRSLSYEVVQNTGQMKNINYAKTDYVLGLFANGHMALDHKRNKGPEGMPSISEMVESAIKLLKKNKNGFFLMVEGGNIDMSHHRGKAKSAIDESAAMEEAVKIAMDMTDEQDTLLIVTSDHTHTLSINGYPYRGTDIFGSVKSDADDSNYTVLTYGTGSDGSYKYYVKENGSQPIVARLDPSLEDTTSYEYQQLAAVKLQENSHGGGDVAIYAKGPYSHLFHNVHEQHYVYHAISYAAKIGAYANSTNTLSPSYCTAFLLAIYSTLCIWTIS